MDGAVDLGGVIEGAGGTDAHFYEICQEEGILKGEEGTEEGVPEDEGPVLLTVFESTPLSAHSPKLKTNDSHSEDTEENNQELFQHCDSFFRPRVLIIQLLTALLLSSRVAKALR